MSEVLSQLFSPINPEDFVGYKDVIESFQKHLSLIRTGKPTKQAFLVIGKHGSGKSSILRKLNSMASMEGLVTLNLNPPYNPINCNEYLNDIKLSIEDMAPGWKGFLARATGKTIRLVDMPPESKGDIAEEKIIKKMAKQFFEDLEKIDKKLKSQEKVLKKS